MAKMNGLLARFNKNRIINNKDLSSITYSYFYGII